MPVRTRSYNQIRPGGRFGQFDFNEDSGNVLTERHSISDLIGIGDNNPFTVDHFECVGGVINRPQTSYFASWFTGYIADALRDSGQWPHISPIPGHLSDFEYAAAAVSRTNLSHPLVDVPNNILEFGDNIRLLKGAGDIISKHFRNRVHVHKSSHVIWATAKAASDVNLAYQFGIVPVVGDAVQLLTLKDAINRRIDGFKRLHTIKGLRRTVPLAELSASATSSKVMQSNRAFIRQDASVSTKTVVRGHVRWLPDDYPNQLYSPEEVFDLASRAVLGLEGTLGIGFSSLWESMPWSWLLDWASNLGNYLDSKRNVLPAKLGSVTISEHTRTDYTAPEYTDGDLTMGSWRVTSESKQRRRASVQPDVHMPFLEASQMGILASLLTARA